MVGRILGKILKSITASFKDMRKVKSLLKEGAHCFEKEQKVFLGKSFKRRL